MDDPGQSHQGGTDLGGGVVIAPGVSVPGSTLRWSFSRSAGPGGQNVNKLSTKAELRVEIEAIPISGRARGRLRRLAGKRVIGTDRFIDQDGVERQRGGELVLTSESERSQARNKSVCLEKLRQLLLEAMVEPKVRRKTKPTKGSIARRIETKKRRGEVKRGRSRGGPPE